MEDFKSQAEIFVKPENLCHEIQKLIPGAYISQNNLEFEAPGYVKDMEWNGFDLYHRIHVHDTYHDSVSMVMGKDFLIAVTRWKNLPVFIPVTNVRLSRSLLYQFFSVLGFIYCHEVVRFIQKNDAVVFQIKWYTATHKLLRFLHGPFNRRLRQLQLKQAAEDMVIRKRRFEMRKSGFKFTTDELDFINSNLLTDNILPPEFRGRPRASLSHLREGIVEEVSLGPLSFQIKKENGGDYLVWPAVCPHEGAYMPTENICDGTMKCPWHGRTFVAARLKPGSATSFNYARLQVALENDELVLSRP